MGRMLLAKVAARSGKDIKLTQSKSHGDYNFSGLTVDTEVGWK